MNPRLELTTELARVAVTIDGKPYTLVEADGAAACAYRNKLIDCAKMDTGGDKLRVTGVQGTADIEPFLVSLLLRDEQDQLVPLATIRKWKARTITKLYNLAKEISELDEANPQQPDSGQTSMTDG